MRKKSAVAQIARNAIKNRQNEHHKTRPHNISFVVPTGNLRELYHQLLDNGMKPVEIGIYAFRLLYDEVCRRDSSENEQDTSE
jgi:hypothetical protein